VTLFLLKDVKKLLAYGHAYYVNKIPSAVPITIYIAEEAYLLKYFNSYQMYRGHFAPWNVRMYL
jgi:hypothetical protein